MASLALYMSIWAGLILVGVLVNFGSGAPDCSTTPQTIGWNNTYCSVQQLYSNPIAGMQNMFFTAFSSSPFLLLVIGASAITGGLTAILTGNNFSLLFILPMILIFALLNMFLLPTATILDPNSNIPAEIQFIYIMFIGTLTVLTIMTFVGGRA